MVQAYHIFNNKLIRHTSYQMKQMYRTRIELDNAPDKKRWPAFESSMVERTNKASAQLIGLYRSR